MLGSIDVLETSFSNLIEFEFHMSTIDMQKNYTINHNSSDIYYGKLISNLFKHHATLASIQKKMEEHFPLNTPDVIDTQDAIDMVLYDYAFPFVITDRNFNLQDKINTSLNNNINPNVVELEDINETWKKSTLLSFGAKRKFVMNGFISWHLWTKATIDKICVKKYLKNKYNIQARRLQKTTFFDNLWVEFCKLNITRFYKLNTQQTFVSHSITKGNILKLIKCIISGRVVELKKVSINHDKSVAKNHSNVNEELGLTKYYTGNDDFNHFCNSKSKFRVLYF